MGILETDILKEKIKDYFRTKKTSWNLLKAINTGAVSLDGPFINWTRNELRQMNQQIRKVMTIHTTLYSRDDIDRLYVIRQEEIGVAKIEDWVDGAIQWLKEYKVKLQPSVTAKITGQQKSKLKHFENKSAKKNNYMIL